MAFINEYPYSDFNEYNLDWCITKMKDLIKEWASVQEDWSDIETQFTDLKNYVMNYFANLNVQTEINTKLDQMVLDGTLSDLVAPFVPDPVTAWLNAHVDPDSPYVVDDTLTIQGAAADAKAVGDVVADMNTRFDKFDIPVSVTPIWFQGMINYNNGTLYNSNNRCRASLKGWDLASKITIENNTMKFRVFEYDEYSATAAHYVGVLNSFATGSITFVPTSGHLYYLMCGASDDANITPDDVTGFTITADMMTDETLSIQGKAADAGITGEVIAREKNRLDRIEYKDGKSVKLYWDLGSIAASTGVDSASSTRIRTRPIVMDSCRFLILDVAAGYKVSYRIYNRDTNQTYDQTSGDWLPEGRHYINEPSSHVYRFVMAKEDDDTMDGTEGSNLTVSAVFIPYWNEDASGYSVPTKTNIRNAPDKRAEIVTVANTYYNHRNDQTGGVYDMEYGYDSCLRVNTYTNEIDCSTFIGLVLRGIPYEDTQYYTKVATEPEDYVENTSVYPWAQNPYNWDYFKEVGDVTKEPATTAAALAQWMVEQGWSVPYNEKLSNVEVGDIVFYSRFKNASALVEPDRFMAINHIAMVRARRATDSTDPWTYDQFPYRHEIIESSDVTPTIRTRLLESAWDDPSNLANNNYNTICLICRPPLN